ncbi:MAG: aminomethyl-transferring glycine dehydrogenase subunit GcvPA [Spirochaetales bacterium]|nr:aminomethyl-transferring glycine dehydrogenase subunit GcvPA [Spirochaetales bacterium]
MRPFVHPYIPNSVPEIREAMLKELGIPGPEAIYAEIPERLRLERPLDLPDPIPGEMELKRHVEAILARNTTCEEYLSFLGGGCWQHYVPAVVDEIVNRSEYLTAYCGMNYSDLGKYQARFEFNSLMAELLEVDAVSEPIYDWGSVAGFSLRMAARITGRNEVLLPGSVCPQRLAQIRLLCQPEIMPNSVKIRTVDWDPESGRLDVADLKRRISKQTAAVYLENPAYLGFIEEQGEEISAVAHENGALLVAGVDPISLGVLKPPASYGADITCGDLQSLGIHMNCGGGQSGFIAFRDEETYVAECPLAIYSIMETTREGQYAFAEVRAERTSYGLRERGKDWVGTASGLWTIAAAVYLSLMGPQGMREIGRTILQNAGYAKKLLFGIKGVRLPLGSPTFKEFVVSFDAAGKSVAEINRGLLAAKIFGGRDIGAEFPQYGNCALYCVTEVHTREDLDRLADCLKEVLR